MPSGGYRWHWEPLSKIGIFLYCEKDRIIAGDFNLVPSILHEIFPAGDRSTGTGSTLNSSGSITNNLYAHLLVFDENATTEMIGNGEVLDVRGEAS